MTCSLKTALVYYYKSGVKYVICSWLKLLNMQH